MEILTNPDIDNGGMMFLCATSVCSLRKRVKMANTDVNAWLKAWVRLDVCVRGFVAANGGKWTDCGRNSIDGLHDGRLYVKALIVHFGFSLNRTASMKLSFCFKVFLMSTFFSVKSSNRDALLVYIDSCPVSATIQGADA